MKLNRQWDSTSNYVNLGNSKEFATLVPKDFICWLAMDAMSTCYRVKLNDKQVNTAHLDFVDD
jgi:hypothetical protein